MGLDDATIEAAGRALGEAAVGRFDEANRVLGRLRGDDGPEAQWWTYALELDRYLAGLDLGMPAAPREDHDGVAQRAASRRAAYRFCRSASAARDARRAASNS